MKNYDIAIIGYGPVGAVTANLFGQKGFNTIVIEPKKEIWDIPRAVHFDGQTQRIFQTMGFMDEISKIIQEENKIDIKPSMIQPAEEIKALGKFKVKISLHSEVDAEITINVSSADTIQ